MTALLEFAVGFALAGVYVSRMLATFRSRGFVTRYS